MKIFSYFCCLIISIFFLSCDKKNGDITEKKEPLTEMFTKDQINEFSAQTMDDKTINIQDYTGKWWVMFIFDTRYLKKNETNYEITPELIQDYDNFHTDFPFLAIIQGNVEDEKDFLTLVQQKNFPFPVINNTSVFSLGKSEKLHHKIFCNPVKIILNPDGKVIYAGCGGGTETLAYKLDSIRHTPDFKKDEGRNLKK